MPESENGKSGGPVGLDEYVLKIAAAERPGARGIDLITESVLLKQLQEAREAAFCGSEMMMVFEDDLLDQGQPAGASRLFDDSQFDVFHPYHVDLTGINRE